MPTSSINVDITQYPQADVQFLVFSLTFQTNKLWIFDPTLPRICSKIADIDSPSLHHVVETSSAGHITYQRTTTWFRENMKHVSQKTMGHSTGPVTRVTDEEQIKYKGQKKGCRIKTKQLIKDQTNPAMRFRV